MSAPASPMATYADLLALPDDVRAEILGGSIVTAPAPLPKHSKVQRALSRFIGGPFDDDDGHGGPGGWWIFVEVDVQLGPHDIVRPDLSGWRRKRLPNPGDLRPIPITPDWVCEILSPSTASRDRVDKLRLYAAHGVPHYWIADADARTLETFVLKDGQWIVSGTYGEGDTVRAEPFEMTEFEVGRLFLPPASG